LNLTPELRRVLRQQDPKLLKKLKAEQDAAEERKYPKPDKGDIDNAQSTLETAFSSFWDQINRSRDLRYQRDMTPEKWRRHLEEDRRVRTRLGHNELLRVAAMLTRNPYKVHCPASGNDDDSLKRRDKQERWLNRFFPSMERRAGRRLRRIAVDNQIADGLGCWELYWTGAYDKSKLNLDYLEFPAADGQPPRKESAHAFLKRTEKELIEAGSPIGLRTVDPLSVVIDRDDEGVCKAIITEMKPYRQVYDDARQRLGADKVGQLSLPTPGTLGWPMAQTAAQDGRNNAAGDVLTIRYYDRRWYSYIVGGTVVDEPAPHGWGRCPIFPMPGIITGSPNLTEEWQGILWGMDDLELSLNDMLTFALDTTFTFNRPHLYVYTEKDGQTMKRNGENVTLDVSNPRKMRQLNPGQEIRDAFAGIKPNIDPALQEFMLNLWQRNGRNPIAQGASPGADPSGYLANSLMSAADDLYGICLENEADVAGEILDTVRYGISNTLEERAYLSAKGPKGSSGTMEWLGLGPDDIDQIPCDVEIDPSSEQNRMAIIQSLTNGWKDGVVPKRIVQERGYGADAPEEWDDEIIVDGIVSRLTALQTDMLVQELTAPPPQAQPSGLVDQNGNPLSSQAPAAGAGASPSGPPQAPAIGAPQAGASNGQGAGSRMNSTQGTAGQNNGYQPAAGAEARAQ
jgi:hypothetical protein